MDFQGHRGTNFYMRADGERGGTKFHLSGRPIGFRAIIGNGRSGNMPIRLNIVYNSCNCPASLFLVAPDATDLSIVSVIGPD